jgi:hypothetical protein
MSTRVESMSYGRSLADQRGTWPRAEERRWCPLYRCTVTFGEFARDYYEANPDASEADCRNEWDQLA